MKRSAWTLALAAAGALAFAGCPPPEGTGPDVCEHLPRSANFGPGFEGVGGTTPAWVGQEASLVVAAPLWACPEDVPRVEVALFDDGNLPRPVEVGLESAGNGAVQARVRFTPDAPGQWLLRVAFEPSLGVVQVPQLVLEEQAPPAIRETFPRSMLDCTDGVTRTRRGAVLCAWQGVTTVYRAGAAVDTFGGEGVVVVGDVVWSVTSGGLLQRRVDTDGGLALTGELPGFSFGFIPLAAGEHTETLAVRDQALTHALIQVVYDGGLALAGSGPFSTGERGFVVAQGEGLWQVTRLGDLTDLARPSEVTYLQGGVVGVGPEGAWVDQGTSLVLVRRPFSQTLHQLTVPRPEPFDPLLSAGETLRRAEVVPALLERGEAPRLVLPVLKEGALQLPAFRTPGQLLNLTPEWVISQADEGRALYFQPRW